MFWFIAYRKNKPPVAQSLGPLGPFFNKIIMNVHTQTNISQNDLARVPIMPSS